MSTKKKAVKRKTASKNSKSMSMTLQMMEKEVVSAPARFASLLSKEVAMLSQVEKKIISNINKIKSQSKNASASKAAKAAKAINELTKQLTPVSKALANAKIQYAKMTALSKQIKQFGKEWTKTAKTKPAASAKPKTTKKKTSSRSKSKATITVLEPKTTVESFDSSMDNATFNETSEATS